MIRPWVRAYCLLAGAMDLSTGLLLVTAPLLTLTLMRVGEQPAEPAWLRFIGAFVAGVGSLYLYPLLRGGDRLAPMMEATTLVRAFVAAFVGVAVLTGLLSPPWLVVFLSDAGLASLQVVMLRRRLFDVVR